MAIAAPMPCGISSRPVMTASSPRTSWKYSGIRTIAPNSAAPSANIVTDAAANALLAYRRTSSSGFAICSARTTKVGDRARGREERDEHRVGGQACRRCRSRRGRR